MARSKKDANGHDPLPLLKGYVIEDPEGRDAAPTLFDLLAPRFREGKCTRLGATLSLRVLGGLYVVRISCPTEQAQAIVKLGTLANLTADLERSVQSVSCVWEPDYQAQQKARREGLT